MRSLWPPLKILLIALILLWGVLAATARLASPLLKEANRPLADWLSAQVGQPVSIHRVKSDWRLFSPRLQLHDVRIGEHAEALQLQRLDIDLDISDLIIGGLGDALRLSLYGLELHLQREANGAIHIAGLPTAGEQDAGPLLLPARVRLLDTRVHWRDLKRNTPPLTLENIRLDAWRDSQQLHLRAQLDDPALGALTLALDIQGHLGDTHWSGQSYLQTESLALSSLLAGYLPEHYQLTDGRLTLELWQTWQNARPIDNRGHAALSQLVFSNPQDTRVELAALAGDFRFQRHNAADWQLQVEQLQVGEAKGEQQSGERQAGALQLMHQTAANGQPWLLGHAQQIPLGELIGLLPLRPPALDAATWRELAISAQLEQVQWRLPLAEQAGQLSDEPDQWQVRGSLSNWRNQPAQDLPGLDGLAIEFNAAADLIVAKLSGKPQAIELPEIFDAPLQVSGFSNELVWQAQAGGWKLWASPLQLSTPDFHAETAFTLQQQNDKGLNIALLGELRDVPAQAVARYLPSKVMSQDTVDWLQSALSEGHVPKASLVLSGPLRDFPFEQKRSGVFEVLADVRDAKLDYQAGWPALTDTDARLHFYQNSLDIQLSRGRIYDSEVTQAQAQISSLDPSSAVRVRGQVKGALQDELHLLSSPALAEQFSHITSALSAQGEAELKLDFNIPLADEPASNGRSGYWLDGQAKISRGRLQLRDWPHPIEDIRGTLIFDLYGLTARDLRAKALGQAVRVAIAPRANGSTRITARTQLTPEQIAAQIPKLPQAPFAGAADFAISLDLPDRKATNTPTWLEVQSELQGMQVKLPAPLGKTAEQQRSLKIRLPLDGSRAPSTFRYGELEGIASHDFQRVELRHARGTPELPEKNQLRLDLALQHFDPNEWLALQTLLPDSSNNAMPWQARIASEQLQLGALSFADSTLTLDSNPERLQGSISGNELTGEFTYATKAESLQIKLTHADLHFSPDPNPDPIPPEPGGADPRALPEFDLQCADLQINDQALGSLSLRGVRTAEGLTFERIRIDGEQHQLDAHGEWLKRADGSLQTQFFGRMDSNDFGNLLEVLGYSRHFHDAAARSDFTLVWPGHPGQLHRANVSGNVLWDIGTGRLSQVEPGITRVLGLVSLDTLKRRLQLNFSDVLKKGYSFDRIQGTFRLEKAQAYTNDLHITGPTGEIDIGGRIGLLSRDLDQLITVVPRLDGTISIGAALAGGPGVGLAALLAQQLAPEKFNELYRFEYQVDGSWDDPKLTALENGGVVSKLINTVTGTKTEKRDADATDWERGSERKAKGPIERLIENLPGQAPQGPIPSKP